MLVADSLLLSLLSLNEDTFARLPETTREALFAVLYDAWSRNEDIQELWLEALQSTNAPELLQGIREALQGAVLPVARALHVPHVPHDHSDKP
jgi:hypothetical protein